MREFRDSLLDDLGRVHGEISGLLERTRKQREQAMTVGGLAPPPQLAEAKPETPTEPAKVPERQ